MDDKQVAGSAPLAAKDALLDAAAALAGAASAYRAYAKRHASQGKGETDPFFSTRISDMDKAVERARAALASPQAEATPAQPIMSAAQYEELFFALRGAGCTFRDATGVIDRIREILGLARMPAETEGG